MTPEQEEAEIYGLFDPESGELRYIGKANNSAKRLKSHLREVRRRKTPLYNWLAKLELPPIVEVLERTCNWREAETRLIAEHRAKGTRLLNIADGGDEPHCPKSIRADNGRMAAKKRNKTVHELICHFGREANWLFDRGRLDAAMKMKSCQLRLQYMTRSQQEDFAGKWAGRHAAS